MSNSNDSNEQNGYREIIIYRVGYHLLKINSSIYIIIISSQSFESLETLESFESLEKEFNLLITENQSLEKELN